MSVSFVDVVLLFYFPLTMMHLFGVRLLGLAEQVKEVQKWV
jgi:hypothetical protein